MCSSSDFYLRKVIDQFVNFIQEHQLFSKNQSILVGVSGGVDSVALVHLLHSWKANFSIAHCNFGLRGAESDADEIFVSGLADSLGVPFYRKYFQTEAFAKKHGISIQMAARDLRFEWFDELKAEHGFLCVALGTHKSDSVETFLINLIRGSGLKGLTGVKPKREHIVRPLLFASRTQIEIYAREQELTWREDSSNADVKYLRNKIRHDLLPQMKELNPNIEEAIHQTALILLRSNKVLAAEVKKFKEQYLQREGDELSINKAVLLERVEPQFYLYHILTDFGFNANQVDDLWKASEAQSGKRIYSSDFEVLFDRERFFIYPKKVFEEQSTGIPESQQVAKISGFTLRFLKEGAKNVQIQSDQKKAFLDFDKLQFPLTLRTWKEGDAFTPLGMMGTKKVSDFLIDEKVPLNKKAQIHVLVSNAEIVWVVGYRISENFKLETNTKNAYIVTVEP